LVDYETIHVKRGESYLKLIDLDLYGTTEEFEEEKFILNYILMSKEKFEGKVELLKSTSTKRLNILTAYS
jgi:hypothetical protein